MITIYGRRGNGPTMQRTVTMAMARTLWGPYFMRVVMASSVAPLVIDDMRVWSVPA